MAQSAAPPNSRHRDHRISPLRNELSTVPVFEKPYRFEQLLARVREMLAPS